MKGNESFEDLQRLSLSELSRRVIGCERCPRLREYCAGIAANRKPEFREWDYWGRPVPGFGDPAAKMWIVGLAPAAHGANRTGRMFTGDSSGLWLYRALHRAGFANQAEAVSLKDGLKLKDVFISASARCAPPDNKPLPEELAHCAPFLDAEYRLLSEVWLFLALGSIGFQTTLKLMERHGVKLPRPRPKFAHDVLYDFGEKAILASYHPSRQNTNTGKLTLPMWNGVFDRARHLIDGRRS